MFIYSPSLTLYAFYELMKNVLNIYRTHILTLLLICTAPLCSSSQRISCARVPGVVKVDSELSIRATEITVREYLEFIASNNFDRTLYPDSALLPLLPSRFLFDDLSKKSGFTYFRLYKQGTGFFLKMKRQGNNAETQQLRTALFMPITAISYEQAVKYCNWLENKFNSMVREFPVCKVHIALPTEADYQRLINNQDSICVSGCMQHCRYNYNYSGIQCDTNTFNGAALVTYKLIRPDFFNPDSRGIYCLQGNAAEMTATPEVAMGGSYMHTARESFNDRQITYRKPERWLGFRFVVTKF